MQRNILFLLMSMVVLSPMAIDIYLASVPVIANQLSASASQIQSTIAIFFFAMGFGQIIVGPLADKYGRRPVALIGLFFYALSSLAASMADSILFMQWCRLLQGFSACAISIIIYSVVRDVYSYAHSGKIYSYLNGVLSVIPALAPVLGSVLASFYGWRSTFVFMFGYALVVLFLIFKFLPETLNEVTCKANKVVKLYSLQRFSVVLKSRFFWYYALSCMSAMAGILSYVSYAPIWLIEHLMVSPMVFSLLFGFNACTSIVCSFIAPVLIQKFGNRAVVCIAFAFMLSASVMLMLGQWLISITGIEGVLAAVSFMLPVAFLSIGLSLVLGPATSMALSQFADKAGTASALLGFIQMVGASIIVVLIQQTELNAPSAVALVLMMLILPLSLMMRSQLFSAWHIEPVGLK